MGLISTCVGRVGPTHAEKRNCWWAHFPTSTASANCSNLRAEREIAISPWRTEAIAREQLCSISKIKEPQSSLCGIKLKIVRALVVYENVCGLLPLHAPERIFIDPGTYIASQGRSILADTTFSYLLCWGQFVNTKAPIWAQRAIIWVQHTCNTGNSY